MTDRELLSGDVLALSDAPPPVSGADVFGLDAEMRAFVADSLDSATDARLKLRRLFDGMKRDGLFKIEYSGIVTRTVQATFHERRGNCLSFTMLFVGLAREAGLDARYQVVDVPPTWTNEAELVVVQSHISATVKTGFDDRTVVDFNLVEDRARYSRQDVDDPHVLGLFYANVGAEALINKDYTLSFRLLRESARVAPRLVAAWVNLGALYSRLDHADYAEAAYLHALAIDPSQRSALSNLTRLYATRGDYALAEVYRQRVRHYQEMNPYYHYQRARIAHDEGRLDAALDELRRALRLKRDEHEFYLLQGRTLLELDRFDEAHAAFDRGREYAEPAAMRAEYDAQVRALAANRGNSPSASIAE